MSYEWKSLNVYEKKTSNFEFLNFRIFPGAHEERKLNSKK